jgi:motility quorum-sensing regulator / GCU-specific mRNA interferase toxin
MVNDVQWHYRSSQFYRGRLSAGILKEPLTLPAKVRHPRRNNLRHLDAIANASSKNAWKTGIFRRIHLSLCPPGIIHIDYIYHMAYLVKMEKLKPHHDLAMIQRVVEDPDSRPFTVTALRNGLALGLDEIEMRATIVSLTRRDFYKSMTTHHDQRVWQDVYHGVTGNDIPVCIKMTAFDDDRPPVIQFKAL